MCTRAEVSRPAPENSLPIFYNYFAFLIDKLKTNLYNIHMFQDIIVWLFVALFMYAMIRVMIETMVAEYGVGGTILFGIATVVVYILWESRKI